jgi:hypothetical protein
VAVPRRTEKVARPPRTILGQEQSAALREKLLADLSQLQSGDEAADWVHKNLAAKNTLITADADAVEAGFREKLSTIDVASAARQEQLHSTPAEDTEPTGGMPFVTTIEDAVAVAPPVTSDNASARRHRDLHSYGDEASWWAGVGIDPLPIALELWQRSRLTYSLDATWSVPLSDADPPPPATVERAPLDDDARLLPKSTSRID